MTAAAPAQTQPPEAELQFDIGSTDDSLERMLELFARLGDIYRVFVPARGSYTYVIHHPDDVKRVLVANHRNYTKGVGLDRVRILLGKGIMTSEGELWKRQRYMMQPLFHRRVLSGFAGIIAAANDRFIARWQALAQRGEPVNLTDEMSELTLAHGGAALLVARAHEHREVVEVLLVPGAPLRDELRYDLGERAKPVRELQVARLLLRDHLEGVAAGLLGQAVQVASEDRAQNDLERELAHLVGQIHELATLRERLPALDAAVIRRRDDTREPAEDAAVEERLHHVALALPQLALARHDALAEEDPDAIEAEALGVVAMIGNQHPLDVIGVVNDIGIRSACRHEHAIYVSQTGEQLDHALQGVIRGADVELQLSLGGLGLRRCGGGHASC